MDTERLQTLIKLLNKASDDYYNGHPSMSDHEFDKLYDELKLLEEKTKIIYPNSPTQNVGYEISKELVKEKHLKPMLSLDKTKDRNVLKDFLGENEGILSYKMDGLTVVFTYDKGKLIKTVTRGNGEIGEVVTNNAKAFDNIPLTIDYKGHLVMRGEAVITYDDFNKINEELDQEDEKYKNPRNLCSGAVRQLDPNITKRRHVRLYAFALVEFNGDEDTIKKYYEKTKRTKEIKNGKLLNLFEDRLEFLKYLGFDIVLYKKVYADNILDTIEWFAKDVSEEPFPSDGLVLIYNDMEYGESLGATSKFPRNALAFKWKDETANTILREIEWSPSRTGLINPVAIFDPVNLEGTEVKRASLHNISIMKDLLLGIGDEISVFKANMIIPQIAENFTKSNKIDIPKKCPICSEKTTIKNENDVETLHCTNPDCPVKHVKGFEHFVSRNAFNIEGISIQTLDSFIEHGFIKEFADIFHLNKHKKEIIELDGFGEKSYNNIINAIEERRKINLASFINALGITGIGTANSKLLAKYYNNDLNEIRNASIEELSNIPEIGPILANAIYDYFHNAKNIKIVNDLVKEVEFEKKQKDGNLKLDNLIFVITGSLNTYENRDALIKVIEDNGGKSASSVSKNTNYLINNDVNSSSSKNKKARELSVKIISEEEFNNMIK